MELYGTVGWLTRWFDGIPAVVGLFYDKVSSSIMASSYIQYKNLSSYFKKVNTSYLVSVLILKKLVKNNFLYFSFELYKYNHFISE